MSRSLLTEAYHKVRPGELDLFRYAVSLVAGIAFPLQVIALSLTVQTLLATSATQPDRANSHPLFSVHKLLGYESPPLRSAIIFLSIAFFLALLQALASRLLLQAASNRSAEFTLSAYRSLFDKSRAMAAKLGVSGQQDSLKEILANDIPKIRDCLFAVLSTNLVCMIQIVVSAIIAFWIHPLLACMGMILGLLAMQCFRWLDQRERTQTPVLRERMATMESRVQDLCQTSPLLLSIQSTTDAQSLLEEQLRTLQSTSSEMASVRNRTTPWMIMVVSLALFLFSMALSIRVIADSDRMTVPVAIALTGELLVAVYAWIRLQGSRKLKTEANESADHLLAFLAQEGGQSHTSDSTLALEYKIELKNVDLKDSRDRILLHDISMEVEVGKITAIIGSDSMQARAIAELLIGFGKPARGQILVDDISASPMNSIDSPQPRSIWVSPDGPLVAGTIESNLHSHGKPKALSEIMEAVRLAGMYESVQNLVDGLATMVAQDDARLEPDHKFRLGIARALLRSPKLVVAEEPSVRVPVEVESSNVDALRQLARQGVAVVVLPSRLETLRHADSIIVLHDHRLSAQGIHAKLLETSELYRHLNYVRFSPLRHIRG